MEYMYDKGGGRGFIKEMANKTGEAYNVHFMYDNTLTLDLDRNFHLLLKYCFSLSIYQSTYTITCLLVSNKFYWPAKGPGCGARNSQTERQDFVADDNI